MSDMNEEGRPEANPWDELFAAHCEFLNALECIHEMFTTVSPVLASKDHEREDRIKEISQEFEQSETDGKLVLRISSIDKLRELTWHLRHVRRADRMFRQNAVVSIVSKFDEFLVAVLRCAFEKNTSWLKHPEKTVTYKQLFETESLEDFISDLILKEVDQLMRGSHHAQVDLLDTKLKLGIAKEFAQWRQFLEITDQFLEITERRNLFVHNAGKVNSIYRENAERFGFAGTEDRVLSATDAYVSEAIDVFYEISVRIAQGAARRLFPECRTDADYALINRSAELLKDERWDLAERILQYALGIPEKLRADPELKYYATINLCIALKFSDQDMSNVLGTIDWTPFHPKYHFAVAILEDRFSDAAELMRTEAVRNKVDQDDLLNWPLLREFRKSREFQDAFSELYGKQVADKLLEQARDEIKGQQSEECEATEEDIRTTYPLDYRELTLRLADRYSDFKANGVYHALRKSVRENGKYVKRQNLSPGNPKSQAKEYYSEAILDLFDKHYTRSAAEES